MQYRLRIIYLLLDEGMFSLMADGSSEIVRGNTELHAGENVVLFARPSALNEVRRVFTA